MTTKSLSDETTLAAVHRLLVELDETKSKMKTMRDNIKDVLTQNDEIRAIDKQLKETTKLKARRKELLSQDRDYQAINTELAELKFKHKDLLEIMSHHLVTYYNEDHETAIKDPEGDVRQLVLNAKLGKPEAIFDDKPKRPSNKQLPGQVSLQSKLEGYGNPGGKVVTQ